jgi:hypothetical protein
LEVPLAPRIHDQIQDARHQIGGEDGCSITPDLAVSRLHRRILPQASPSLILLQAFGVDEFHKLLTASPCFSMLPTPPIARVSVIDPHICNIPEFYVKQKYELFKIFHVIV